MDADATGSQLPPGAPVIGYLTVAEDGPETSESAEAIDFVCRRAGWEILEIVRDRDDGTRTLHRPGLTYALGQIAMGEARALVVANARHLSRSIVDLGALMDVFRDGRAALIALDLGVDTSTPEGRRIAAVVGTLGMWERERIVRRTSAGLEAARSKGRRVGRPGIKDKPALGERIINMRAGGMTLQEIADELNAEGVPTVRGGRLWRPSSVQTALGYRRPNGGRPQAMLRREWNGADDST
jgi:DNA invertase Pin-like site-specific DNA recombinase